MQVPELKATLKAIPATHVAELRANVKKVQPLFRYPDPRGVYSENNMLPILYFQLWKTATLRA